jgi:hypothetical protein
MECDSAARLGPQPPDSSSAGTEPPEPPRRSCQSIIIIVTLLAAARGGGWRSAFVLALRGVSPLLGQRPLRQRGEGEGGKDGGMPWFPSRPEIRRDLGWPRSQAVLKRHGEKYLGTFRQATTYDVWMYVACKGRSSSVGVSYCDADVYVDY